MSTPILRHNSSHQQHSSSYSIQYPLFLVIYNNEKMKISPSQMREIFTRQKYKYQHIKLHLRKWNYRVQFYFDGKQNRNQAIQEIKKIKQRYRVNCYYYFQKGYSTYMLMEQWEYRNAINFSKQNPNFDYVAVPFNDKKVDTTNNNNNQLQTSNDKNKIDNKIQYKLQQQKVNLQEIQKQIKIQTKQSQSNKLKYQKQRQQLIQKQKNNIKEIQNQKQRQKQIIQKVQLENQKEYEQQNHTIKQLEIKKTKLINQIQQKINTRQNQVYVPQQNLQKQTKIVQKQKYKKFDNHKQLQIIKPKISKQKLQMFQHTKSQIKTRKSKQVQEQIYQPYLNIKNMSSILLKSSIENSRVQQQKQINKKTELLQQDTIQNKADKQPILQTNIQKNIVNISQMIAQERYNPQIQDILNDSQLVQKLLQIQLMLIDYMA